MSCADASHVRYCPDCEPQAFEAAGDVDLGDYGKLTVDAVVKAAELFGPDAPAQLGTDVAAFFAGQLGGAEAVAVPFIRGVMRACETLSRMGVLTDTMALVVASVVDELEDLRAKGLTRQGGDGP